MSNQEHRIQNALNDLQTNRFSSIRQAAAYNDVPRSTLTHRRGGRNSKANIERKSQRLTNQEEKLVIQWIQDLQKQHISPNYSKLRTILTNLLRKKGDRRPLGKHFITRFISRHPELKAGFSRLIDAKRLSALDSGIMEEFFVEFNRLRNDYKVDFEDIYNMDETGFQMGHSQAEYVVFNSTEGRPIASQPENTT
jgi:Tc5 transposase DNA-binding domain